eukprot:scaffold21742_cov126-Isochrysis_galbana.AAC.2
MRGAQRRCAPRYWSPPAPNAWAGPAKARRPAGRVEACSRGPASSLGSAHRERPPPDAGFAPTNNIVGRFGSGVPNMVLYLGHPNSRGLP